MSLLNWSVALLALLAPVAAQDAVVPAEVDAAESVDGDADADAGEPAAREPDPYPHPIETDELRKPRTRTGGTFWITNVTLHDAIRPARIASVFVEDGRIAQLVDSPALVHIATPVAHIDGTGKHLAPGVVDAHSHMAIGGGVNEGTVSISAEVDMADVIDPKDRSLYGALAGGCTTIQVLHGSANAIGGQAALLKLRFDSTEDRLHFAGAPKGIKFALGENPKRSNWGEAGERFPATRLGVEALFHRAFGRAREYAAELARARDAAARGEDVPPVRRDLRLEALVRILDGDLVVHAHSYRADEILMLMRVAEGFGFKVGTLHHVLEGYKVAREIAEHGAGTATFSDWWAYKIEAYDAVPGNAELLDRAGVLSSVKSDSDELVRHLYHEAAKSVGYAGLDRVRALRLVTLNPAKQLGIADRVGSIEIGKDADLALLDGEPLSVYSKVLMTFVDGEVEFERRDAFGFDGAPVALAASEGDVVLERASARSPSSPPLAIRGATLHPVEGEPIPDGTLVVQDGRIAAFGASVAVPEGAELVDGTGLHLYPGLVALDTTIGLREIESIRATVDQAEEGGDQPDVSVAASLHADSAHIAVTRERGITLAQSAPRGRGPLLGQSAVLELTGDTWEELLVLDRDMLHVRVPFAPNTEAVEPRRRRGGGARPPEPNDRGEEETRLLERAFRAGADYSRLLRESEEGGTQPPAFDPRLAALAPYALGEKRVALHAQNAQTILRALDLAGSLGLDAVLYGASEAWKVAGAIADAGVPVVVGPVLSLPSTPYDPYDAPYANAAALAAAGVQVAIGAGNDENPRNVGFHAGFASAFGLDRAAALRAVTLEPARILGLDHEAGSLAVGKRADLVLADGDVLEPTTRIHAVWIGGRRMVEPSRQTELYQRFERRLERSTTR